MPLNFTMNPASGKAEFGARSPTGIFSALARARGGPFDKGPKPVGPLPNIAGAAAVPPPAGPRGLGSALDMMRQRRAQGVPAL